jgi:ureidoglycolate hydrolase
MPALRRVPVRPLEPSSFARYGSIVEAGAVDDPSLNRAPGQMAFMWVHRDLQYPRMPFIATCRYIYRGARCDYVQRHPESTVVLIPIDGKPSIIWFLPDANGLPDTERAEAILLDGTRGIVISPSTWIRYAYPVTDTADFAYVSARVDPEEDIERAYLERDQGTVLEWYFDLPLGKGIETTPGGAVLKLPLRGSDELKLGVGGVIVRDDAGGRR